MNKKRFETDCIHAGYVAESGQPQVIPMHQNTTYRYYDGEKVANMFDLESSDFMYSRIGNPTVAALEARMTALEGGTASVATSSGMAATMITVLNICNTGDEILSSTNVYGGTHNFFMVALKRLGITTKLFDQDLPAEDIIAIASDKVKMVFVETLGNPALSIADFEKLSKVAKALGVPLVVDNTLASPALCRPLEHGANIVVNATTKYADGHATSMGGMVTEGGNFDWKQNDKFKNLTEPDESYHGLCFYDKFGDTAFCMRLTAVMMRDFGCTMAPMNAFMTAQGLQTLPIRMERHSENALKVAKFLEKHDMVTWVNYPGLESSKYHELANKYMPNGASGVICFGIKGGKEAGDKLVNGLETISLEVHVGEIRTSFLHPASTTHRQLTEEQQRKAGINPELIRLSVGLENADDLIEDLDNALNALK